MIDTNKNDIYLLFAGFIDVFILIYIYVYVY